MKKIILAGIVILAVAGCESIMPSVDRAKVQANQRWNETRAQMLTGVAEEHFNVGQLDSAETKLTRALELSPTSTAARLLLAKVYIERGEHAAARRELHRVLDASARHPTAQFLLGVALEQTGDLPAALEAYRQAYTLDKSDMSAVRAAAEVLVQMGRLRRAQAYIDSYLPRAENDPAAFEIAGRIAAMRGDDERAVEAFRRAVDLDGEHDGYRRALARAQFRCR
ncbi:MAG: tetratricopeptide repeat protein, partial [Planctomycetota bacterium]